MCCRGKYLQHLVSIEEATGSRDHYSLAGTLWMKPLWDVCRRLCEPKTASSSHTLTFKFIFGHEHVMLPHIHKHFGSCVSEQHCRLYLVKNLPFLSQKDRSCKMNVVIISEHTKSSTRCYCFALKICFFWVDWNWKPLEWCAIILK